MVLTVLPIRRRGDRNLSVSRGESITLRISSKFLTVEAGRTGR
jgi:hypothetical protein